MISSTDHHGLSVVSLAQASLGTSEQTDQLLLPDQCLLDTECLTSFEKMFCAPVRSQVDAIDGIYFLCLFISFLLH